MKISEIFRDRARVFSAEVFPPKRDGNLDALFSTIEELKALDPSYISVTYGAGGSTRDMTYDIAVRLLSTGILPLVHLTCVGQSRGELKGLLGRLDAAGIENILALRGDPPRGETAFRPVPDGFRYASELVGFIRSEGFPFCLGVAGYPSKHPEAPGLDADLDRLKDKVEAGAGFIVTQLFLENAEYYRLVEGLHRRGCHVPVQPGIWIITDDRQIERICALSGMAFPGDLRVRLEKFREDRAAMLEIGVEYATRQCADLLRNGAPGIHFYAMNRSGPALAVHGNLRALGLVH
jgi:methylenetetrahydrofolate reductase (NADPH)